MIRSHIARLAVPATLALTAVWLARPAPARACSPDPCPEPVRTFGEDAWVPGNLVRFAIREGFDPSTLDLELRTAAGDVIPGSVQGSGSDRYFAPDETIAPDTQLVLSYTRVCNQWAAMPGEQTVEYAFTATGGDAIEAVPPELVLSEQGQMFLGPGFPEHVFKRYRISTGLNPSVAGHLLEVQATVEGRELRLDRTGYEPTVTLAANCEQTDPIVFDSCGTALWLSPGKHTLTVSSRVTGEPARPDLTLEVELSCGAQACEPAPEPHEPDPGMEPEPSEPDPQSEGGASGAGGAAATGGSSAMVAPETPSTQSSGCVAAPGARGASGGALGLALGVLALLTRRAGADRRSAAPARRRR